MHYFRSFKLASYKYIKIIQNYALNRSLESGKRLHAHLIINSLTHSTHITSNLIHFYIKCHQINYARKVFDEIPERNTRSWNILLGAYTRHGLYNEAMGVFFEMQSEGLELNKFVLPNVLKACGHVKDRRIGEKLHAVVIKQELRCDVFVCSALIDMYSKCGRIESARLVFDLMVERDLVVVNTMVAACAQHGLVNEALTLVEEMRSIGIMPDLVTWNTLIAVFSQANDGLMVTKLFKLMREGGIEPDVVSWTSVISGFAQNLENNKAFDAFKKMLADGMRPTSATISSLLPACANLADSIHGKEIHGYSVVTGVEKDIFVCSALIDMYAKCGFIHEAKTLFNNMTERNTITWNSMIFGFANHGYCKEAISLYNQMVDEKIKLDHLTFTAVLTACSQSGMVDFGKTIFLTMQERYNVQPRLEHYACMVHLLGQEGKLTEAHELIQNMPVEPDLFVWGAFLGACKLHGDIGLAQMAAKHVAKLEPESAGSSLLLSSLYADVGHWGYSARVKHKMKKMKLKTLQASSWIGSA